MYGLVLAAFTMVTCVVGSFTGIHPLIMGGKHTSIEEAPYMAQYLGRRSGREGKCGASILSERFVLSAAHCYHGPELDYIVVVGTDVPGTESGGRVFKVEQTTVHPLYNAKNHDYDVLVLKLGGKLQFSAKIKPIKMADPRFVIKEGAILEALGFGITEKGYVSEYLRKVRVPYVDQRRCRYYLQNEITDRMMCAGKPYADSCRGDSGGPLIYGNILVGVVSFGINCDINTIGIPGVYARVSSVRDFIDDVMDST